MVALVIDSSSELSGSILTVTVASELELNGISPPPDMIEEEQQPPLQDPFKVTPCLGAWSSYINSKLDIR